MGRLGAVFAVVALAAAPCLAATPAAAKAGAPGGLPELAPLARAVLPSVVGVLTKAAEPPRADRDDEAVKELFDRFHRDGPRQGLATGFVVHRDGWVLTNAHVVEGAGEIEVDLGEDGGKIAARVVGADPATDVAVLKVDAGRPLPAVQLGDSDRLEIADWILVVGNPFGLSQSVTLGIVSQLGRTSITPASAEGYHDFIQTDASINPGNSGGPLVNLRGEVVGIATAINATGQGIGFAVPINMAKEVLAQIRRHGRVVRSWIGMSVRELPPEPGHRRRGVLVTGVVAGGPAASAGIAEGDVITQFDGREVAAPSRLRWFVASAGVGKRVPLVVRRGAGEEHAVQVELSAVPAAGAEPVSRANATRQ